MLFFKADFADSIRTRLDWWNRDTCCLPIALVLWYTRDTRRR